MEVFEEMPEWIVKDGKKDPNMIYSNDRFSNLCDDILINILTRLTTKQAVQTCILSKRWSRVWTSMPVLKFDVNEFSKNKGAANSQIENDRVAEDRLARFVNGVLKSRGSSPLDTFKYFCLKPNNTNCCRNLEWLDQVTSLMPRVINVYSNNPKCSPLPGSIFSCASLEELKLHICPVSHKAISARSINLPYLKVLDLRNMGLRNDAINTILSGCPALERLILGVTFFGTIDITSDRLKELKVHCRTFQKMKISCPALVSLSSNFMDPLGDILLDSMPSLENAAIMLDGICGLTVLNVLRGLLNASTIKLAGDRLLKGLLEKQISNCGTFDCLKRLEIGRWDMINDFDLIASFLEKSPNLQELSLQIIVNFAHVQEQPSEQATGDLFVREYLDTVKISYGTKSEQAKLAEVLRRHIRNIGNIVFQLTCSFIAIRAC